MLDVEVAASVAPGAKVAVYFTPNTDQGFLDAITTAVHDAANKPSVISISWGGPESSWTAQSMTAMDEACQSAAALGVTITVAAGDNGSTDGGTGNNVDFPASSPHVLACGGTKLDANGATNRLRGGVERVGQQRGRNRRRREQRLCFTLVAGESAGAGGDHHYGRPRRTGCGWRRRSDDGYTIRVDGQTMVIGERARLRRFGLAW